MPRDGAIIFGDLIGKLGMVRINSFGCQLVNYQSNCTAKKGDDCDNYAAVWRHPKGPDSLCRKCGECHVNVGSIEHRADPTLRQSWT
jgi:hypothetical protein